MSEPRRSRRWTGAAASSPSGVDGHKVCTPSAEPHDPVIVAALNYERATLEALQAFSAIDDRALKIACATFLDTLVVLRNMAANDRDRAVELLTQRGHIQEQVWQIYATAIELLGPGADPGSPGLRTIH